MLPSSRFLVIYSESLLDGMTAHLLKNNLRASNAVTQVLSLAAAQAAAVQLRDDNTVLAEPNPQAGAAAGAALRPKGIVAEILNPKGLAGGAKPAAGGAGMGSLLGSARGAIEETGGAVGSAALAAALDGPGGVPSDPGGGLAGLGGAAGALARPRLRGAVGPGLRLGLGLGFGRTLQFLPQLLAVLGVVAVFLLWSLTRRRRGGAAAGPPGRNGGGNGGPPAGAPDALQARPPYVFVSSLCGFWAVPASWHAGSDRPIW